MTPLMWDFIDEILGMCPARSMPCIGGDFNGRFGIDIIIKKIMGSDSVGPCCHRLGVLSPGRPAVAEQGLSIMPYLGTSGPSVVARKRVPKIGYLSSWGIKVVLE